MNADLPTFVAMISKGSAQTGQPLYDRLWGSGFLPTRYQGSSSSRPAIRSCTCRTRRGSTRAPGAASSTTSARSTG